MRAINRGASDIALLATVLTAAGTTHADASFSQPNLTAYHADQQARGVALVLAGGAWVSAG